LTYLKNLKYFIDRNIELLKFREDTGLEEALKLRQSIDDFETLNGSEIELFMNKVQKATRKQRK
jgi:hypothetical protein